MSAKPKPNWEKIARACHARLLWVLSQGYKMGNAIHFENGEAKFESVRDIIADDLETWPGVKIDREASKANELPRKEWVARQRKRNSKIGKGDGK